MNFTSVTMLTLSQDTETNYKQQENKEHNHYSLKC